MKNTFWVVLTAKTGAILKSDVKKFDKTITGIRKTKIARHFLTQEDCVKHINGLQLSRSYNVNIVTDIEYWK
jgi:hypothetical protein